MGGGRVGGENGKGNGGGGGALHGLAPSDVVAGAAVRGAAHLPKSPSTPTEEDGGACETPLFSPASSGRGVWAEGDMSEDDDEDDDDSEVGCSHC